MNKGYIEFIGLKIFEKDIQKVRIKKDSDKDGAIYILMNINISVKE